MANYKVPQLGAFEWQQPVKDKDLSAPPGGESKGDRYIVKATGSGAWVDQSNNIATYNGATWDFTPATEGMIVWINDEDKFYKFISSWTEYLGQQGNQGNQGSQGNQGASFGSIEVLIDGGGQTIATGKKVWVEVPFACTLTAYSMIADVAGAIVVDVNRSTYSNFPTTSSMPGSGKEPTITATNQKSQDTNITDWTSDDVVAGDILEFEVDSCTTITKIILSLSYTRT